MYPSMPHNLCHNSEAIEGYPSLRGAYRAGSLVARRCVLVFKVTSTRLSQWM